MCKCIPFSFFLSVSLDTNAMSRPNGKNCYKITIRISSLILRKNSVWSQKYGDFKTGTEMISLRQENNVINSFPERSHCVMDLYVSFRLQLRRRAIFLNTETNQILPSFHTVSIALVCILISTRRVV